MAGTLGPSAARGQPLRLPHPQQQLKLELGRTEWHISALGTQSGAQLGALLPRQQYQDTNQETLRIRPAHYHQGPGLRIDQPTRRVKPRAQAVQG